MKDIIFILFLFISYIGIIDPATTTISTTKQQSTGSVTTRPAPIYCYNCANCPRPFNPQNANVQQALSPHRWCVKMSLTDPSDGIYTRGPDPGYCSSEGCSWKTTFGIRQWVCCCNHNLCNVALPTSKLSIAGLLLSLTIILLIK